MSIPAAGVTIDPTMTVAGYRKSIPWCRRNLLNIARKYGLGYLVGNIYRHWDPFLPPAGSAS
jgi:hypothetical protein